jgi:diguanylate cyclase (GGDEF)-like protein
MSKVLSEPAAASKDGGFAFFPRDARQALRIQRLLIASGTSALVSAIFVLCAALNLMPMRAALQVSGAIFALIGLFYVLFRTRLNLRFSDPSLTTAQIAAGILVVSYAMYYAAPVRGALSLLYLVALLFGVLRLNTLRLLLLALLALGSYATMQALSLMYNPAADASRAIAQLVILAIVLPWFAVMGGYVNRLRRRLSDSHRELNLAFERIGQLAIRDELTGIYNRRHLLDELARERSRSERLRTAFSVLLVDIDHFKSINDSFGHAAGDAVLKHVAALAPGAIREVDVFGRYGGEEFLLILPGADLQGAAICAERLRARLESSAVPGIPAGRRVTATIGAASYVKGEQVAALLRRADEALYRGKGAGRNRVITMG